MRLFVAIELADRRDPTPVTVAGDLPTHPLAAGNRPLANFVAQLVSAYLRLPQSRARRRRAQFEVSSTYTAVSVAPLPNRPTLDRLI